MIVLLHFVTASEISPTQQTETQRLLLAFTRQSANACLITNTGQHSLDIKATDEEMGQKTWKILVTKQLTFQFSKWLLHGTNCGQQNGGVSVFEVS
jgi:hypothetical protein